MISKTMFPGKYIQGYNAIEQLGPELARLGRNIFVISGPVVLEKVLPVIKEKIAKEVNLVIERFGGECSDEEIGRLKKLAGKAKGDVIVGIGGGKTLDTAKAVAYGIGAPVVIVPTSASSDAPCTALCVIHTVAGKFKKLMPLPSNPDVVLVDTGIVVQAPVRLLVAGMGDALSTTFEVESCQKKFTLNLSGFVSSMTAGELAHLSYRILLEYGATAKKACEARVVIPAVERVVEANTLLSGLGHESGGAATAHAVNNGLTTIEEAHDSLHGEKVAFGTLTSLFLTDKPKDVIDRVYSFYESVGLPSTLADVGISNASDKTIWKIAQAACASGGSIYNEPMPISTEAVFAAIKIADLEGGKRKTLKD
jgi:glycerol dehydrogenase